MNLGTLFSTDRFLSKLRAIPKTYYLKAIYVKFYMQLLNGTINLLNTELTGYTYIYYLFNIPTRYTSLV